MNFNFFNEEHRVDCKMIIGFGKKKVFYWVQISWVVLYIDLTDSGSSLLITVQWQGLKCEL